MKLDTFISPWESELKGYNREGTIDWNTLQSCITEDEYRVAKLPKEGVGIDIGGYIGACTLALASKGYKVYMAEPLPENIEIAQKNIEINKFQDVVKIYPNAITSKNKYLTPIYYNDTSSDLGKQHEFIGMPINSNKSGKKLTVSTRTLEHIFEENNIERCNFLKVDIEGGEWDIFENIPEYLLDKIDRIAIEMDGATEKPTSTEELLKLLKGKFIDVSKEYFPDWCAPGTSVHGYFVNKNI